MLDWMRDILEIIHALCLGSCADAQEAVCTHSDPIAISLPNSLKEELLKDDYIYIPSDNDIPLEPQQQPFEEAPAQQSEQQKQTPGESSPRNMDPEPPTNHPRQWEYDVTSFTRLCRPPSQPTQPSEPTVSQLEILEEVVVYAGVTAALKFAKATSAKPSFTAAELYKTSKKKKEIMEELIEKCYRWMTHVKQTKDNSNEYDAIFVLKHEANYEGVRQYFMSLMPKQQGESTVITIHSMILNQIKGHQFQEQIYIVPLDIVMFMLGTHGMDYTDPRTKKTYRFDIDQYAHHRRFLDKRKPASHPFYMKGVRFIRGRISRVYHAEWSTSKNLSLEEIDGFRHEYGSNILLHEMNKIRDKVIRASECASKKCRLTMVIDAHKGT
ncbi:hypothetical protein AHAS_Ahas01G0135500 [Arachis hypogaea]